MKLLLAALLCFGLLTACRSLAHGTVQYKGHQPAQIFWIGKSMQFTPERWYLTICNRDDGCHDVTVSHDEYNRIEYGGVYDERTPTP